MDKISGFGSPGTGRITRYTRDTSLAVAHEEALWLPFLRNLGPRGRRNWQAFRRVAQSFTETSHRLQFLTYTPDLRSKMQALATLPESTFSNFAKWELLEFMAFARFCFLKERSSNIRWLELENEAATLGSKKKSTVMDAARKAYIRELKGRIVNPQIPLADNFPLSVEWFRTLIRRNSSPQVFMALEYPKYIWISPVPPPDRFKVRNVRHGKWIINYKSPEDAFAAALKLLPYFSAQSLGYLKFELGLRGGRVASLIVYCNDQDPTVKSLVQNALQKDPFWSADELDFEAEALLNLSISRTTDADLSSSLGQSTLDKLGDEKLMRSYGLSESQAGLLWHYLTKSDVYQDPDNSFSHVIDGLFVGQIDLSVELDIDPTGRDLFERTLPVILSSKNRNSTREFLEAQRAAFQRTYSGNG